MSADGRVLGSPRLHLRKTDSTNEQARTLAAEGAPHGTLVTAAEQTAGRGRQGRRWSAPAGSSLLMSLVLREPPMLLPLQSALAVCDAAGPRALIKWPNDVVVELPGAGADGTPDAGSDVAPSGRRTALGKLAGILIETRPQAGWAVLGIGLNVAVRLEDLPDELRADAGAARPAATLGRAPEDVEPTLAELLAALERRMAEESVATLEAWRTRDALLGRQVSWSEGRGRAAGIDGMGRLVVELEGGGQTELGAGEVHLEGIGG
jgi:BirA family transcriptional regulator, biotin operon repressor / biotin---[acetyl-CoA-carboxylase] ligase